MSPSPFVVEWVARVAREIGEARGAATGRLRGLDVAMGRGRHAIVLASAGIAAFGVDRNFDALVAAGAAAAAGGLAIRAWCADLTRHPLPLARFEIVVVTRYLQRDLFAALQRAVSPRGCLLYETFTTAQRALGTGPTSPDHLLEPGELRARFQIPGWQSVFYEETSAPEAVARIVARRSG